MPLIEIEASKISIHALREEGDRQRGEVLRMGRHFYPRPPRGGRPQRKQYVWAKDKISIHALREEGDITWATNWQSLRTFLSTPSARRATIYTGDDNGNFKISIHALREEGDCDESGCTSRQIYFYPRPPRGGRLLHFSHDFTCFQFLSTPSARRATLPSAIHS